MLLATLSQQYSLLWLCVGDFNEVFSGSEQLGGAGWRKSQMHGFPKMVHECQLVDLGFVGSDYTWMVNREDEVHCRLDRELATKSWISLFPCFRVCHLNLSKSDYLPIVVEI